MRSTGLDKTTKTTERRYTQEHDGAVMDGVFGVRFLCVNDHNGNLAADLLNKYDAHYIALTAERDALRETLQDVRVRLMHGPDDIYQKRTLIIVDSALALSEGR